MSLRLIWQLSVRNITRHKRRNLMLFAAIAVAVPAFAIGGIEEESVEELARAGCRRIAVASAVLRSGDPERTARTLRTALVGS